MTLETAHVCVWIRTLVETRDHLPQARLQPVNVPR